jgi:VIT1/CCC1 family predicted Fe2+/Mn2+ transporter
LLGHSESESQRKDDGREPKNALYGFGLVEVVVVVSVFFVSAGGFTMVVFFSILFAGGFTMVVLFSVFFSAGAAGATVSVFCSHAPRSAALAKMQISFLIDLIGWYFTDQA